MLASGTEQGRPLPSDVSISASEPSGPERRLQAMSAQQQLQSLRAILAPNSIVPESAINVCRNAAGAKILLGTGFFGKVCLQKRRKSVPDASESYDHDQGLISPMSVKRPAAETCVGLLG